MRRQEETISWEPVAQPHRPDVERTVLICTEDGDLVLGYWDDSDDQWLEADGTSIDRPVYWAAIEGPWV